MPDEPARAKATRAIVVNTDLNIVSTPELDNPPARATSLEVAGLDIRFQKGGYDIARH